MNTEDIQRRLEALELRAERERAQNRASMQRYRERHPEVIKAITQRVYAKLKEDPERLAKKREAQQLSYARQQLAQRGHLTSRAAPLVIEKLGLQWNDAVKGWVLPSSSA